MTERPIRSVFAECIWDCTDIPALLLFDVLTTKATVRSSSPSGSLASVTRTVNTSPFFMVTVRLSSVSNGSMLIKAQSPACTVCALISSICSSVNSPEYSTSSLLASFRWPTVVSSSTLPTQTRPGSEKSTFSTSDTNCRVVSLISTSFSVNAFSEGVSSALFSLSLFSSCLSVSATPRISMSDSKLINPPPGMLNSYIFPSTSQWKSTV